MALDRCLFIYLLLLLFIGEGTHALNGSWIQVLTLNLALKGA